MSYCLLRTNEHGIALGLQERRIGERSASRETLLRMQWKPFKHDGNEYDLSHLHPRTLKYERDAQGKKSVTIFTVDVTYGLHCFSCDPPKGAIRDPALEYADARHVRIFSFERYELSKRLPGIIDGLAERKCHNSGKGNFFTIEVIDDRGRAVDYDIFFQPSKSSRKGRINLFVQSAYVRERKTLQPGRPIAFLVVLHNVLNGIPIKP